MKFLKNIGGAMAPPLLSVAPPLFPDQYSLQHLADPFTVSVMLRPLMLAALSGVLLHRRLPDITLIPSSLTTSYMFWLV